MNQPIKKEEGIDINKLFQKFVNKWYVFAIFLIAAIAIAVFIVKTAVPIYSVYSILKYDTGSSKTEKILSTMEFGKQDVVIEDKMIEIRSTDYIRETINQMEIGISYFRKNRISTYEIYRSDSPYQVIIDSAKNQLTGVEFYIETINNDEFYLEFELKNDGNYRLYNFQNQFSIIKPYIKQKFRKKYQFDQLIEEPSLDFAFTVNLIGDPEKFGDEQLFFKINALDQLTDRYLNALTLEVSGRDSYIIFMRLGSQILQNEMNFLNTLMDVVIQKNLNEKNQEALKTIDFIDYQIADVSSSLTRAESDLESIGYAETSIGESSVLYRQRGELETQISDYNAQLQNLRSFVNNLQTIEGSPSQIGSLDFRDQLIDNLLLQLTELLQQKANLKRTATEANPAVQRVNLEIETTKDALRNALNGAISNINVLLESLNNRLNQVNTTINRLPSAERRKLGIQRKFTFSDNTYDMLMQRKATAGITLATNQPDWSIVEYAKVDTELLWPKSKFIFLLSIFLGLLIPAVLIIIADLLSTRIKNKEDLLAATSIPILGSIVKGSKKKKLLTQYNSRSALSESFRDIRVNMQFLSPEVNNKIIGITSASSQDGKSFIATNLAIVLAQSGKRVLLLDADLRNSTLGDYFDLKNFKPGLSTYLIGANDINESIIPSGIKNLDIIPAGPKPPNPSDLLISPKTEYLLNELPKLYDYVVVDAPPIGLVGDFLIASKFFEINLYVVRQGYTRKNSFEKINNVYENKILKNLHIIFNDTPLEEVYGGNPYYVTDKKEKKKSSNIDAKKEKLNV
jgi:capsular exopolysaccharide synthesis family protein